MSRLYLLASVVSRRAAGRFAGFYRSQGLEPALTVMGQGTASSEVLDYFGLDGGERSLLFHVVTDAKWRELRRLLRLKMNIDVPGVGIAFLIPMSSIGGARTLQYLTSGLNYEAEEETTLKDTRLELLVAVANQGTTEQVMEAARRVHATGGTVFHAKGTGGQLAEKFMGVTLVPEKDVVFLVVRREQKNDIMRAIMAEAGPGTRAGAVVFSLPVTDTAGMRMIEDEETDEV